MIKLGDAYFNEASITAIMPCDADGCYIVHFDRGGFYQWTANAVEVQRRLEEVGLIEPQSTSVPDLNLTVSELAELGVCLANGYSYAAKDDDGRVWAYEQAPAKGERSWINNDDVSRVAGLTAGRYAALSFEDECPLDIAVALEEVL